MDEQNNIQLAIGYGLGTGIVLAGVLLIILHLSLSFIDIDVSLFVIGSIVIIGGAIIAIYNARKLDQNAISDI